MSFIIHKVIEWFAHFHEWFAHFHTVKRTHSTTNMNRLEKKHKIRIIKSIINV